MNAIAGLMCIVSVAVLAIYWTVWKIRAELNQNLGEIRKLLEKK